MAKCGTNIANDFVSSGFTSGFAAALRYRFNSCGRGTTDIRPRSLVMTGTNHCMLGGIVLLRVSRISRSLSDSVLSVQCSISGA